MDLQEILDDLQTVFPSEINITSPPYAQDMDLKEKFNSTYRSLRRSIRLKSRILSLINAFYLGEILANLTSTKDHHKYKQKLTLHYATIAEYTYDIFESCPNQIMKVQKLSVQIIRKLKRAQILEIRTAMIIFAGAQNLEEEIVNV